MDTRNGEKNKPKIVAEFSMSGFDPKFDFD
jgi:hypothetical protein